MIHILNIKKKIVIKLLDLIAYKYDNIYDNISYINFFNKDNIYLLDNNYINFIMQLSEITELLNNNKHNGAGVKKCNKKLLEKIKFLEASIKRLFYQNNLLMNQRNFLYNNLFLKNKEIESLQNQLKFILDIINNETSKLDNSVSSNIEDILTSINDNIQQMNSTSGSNKNTLNLNIEGTLKPQDGFTIIESTQQQVQGATDVHINLNGSSGGSSNNSIMDVTDYIYI